MTCFNLDLRGDVICHLANQVLLSKLCNLIHSPKMFGIRYVIGCQPNKKTYANKKTYFLVLFVEFLLTCVSFFFVYFSTIPTGYLS